MERRILEIDPSNLSALIVDANVKGAIALKAVTAAGRPRPADLPKYPAAYRALQAMQAAMLKVENLGYQDMPAEAYQLWLKSLEAEKKKQSTLAIQARMQREIRALRQAGSTLHNVRN
jgi:hypothetical protein